MDMLDAFIKDTTKTCTYARSSKPRPHRYMSRHVTRSMYKSLQECVIRRQLS